MRVMLLRMAFLSEMMEILDFLVQVQQLRAMANLDSTRIM